MLYQTDTKKFMNIKNNKFNYIWFSLAVAQCCISAFIFGETGDIINLLAAGFGFAGYTATTVAIYRARKIQLLFSIGAF